MISTVRIGSKQYSVTLGSRIRVEKLDAKKGDTWISKEVLAVQDDKGGLTLGTPLVSQAEIKSRVVCHGKNKKVLILKKKRRKGYRRTQGHRQAFTELFVEALSDSKGQWVELKKQVKTSQKAVSKKPVSQKTTKVEEKKASTKKASTTKTTKVKTFKKTSKKVTKAKKR